jgi:hypothetical protein
MSETAAASWVSRDFEGHRIDLSAAIAKIFGSRISGAVSANDHRSGGAELRRSEALLAAVRQKPGCKCNKSDDHQKNGRICEGVERLRQLLHWPDLPFVLNQSAPPASRRYPPRGGPAGRAPNRALKSRMPARTRSPVRSLSQTPPGVLLRHAVMPARILRATRTQYWRVLRMANASVQPIREI